MKFKKKKKEFVIDKKMDLASNICDRFKNCSDFSCDKIVSQVTNVEIYLLIFILRTPLYPNTKRSG